MSKWTHTLLIVGLGMSALACGDDADGETTMDAALEDGSVGGSGEGGTADAATPDASSMDASTDGSANGTDGATGADAAMDADTDGGDDAAPEDGSPPDAAGATTFTRVYEILSTRCAPCHTSGTSGGLGMADKATAYDELVDVEAEGGACGPSGATRVVAGNPSSSLLIQKLEGPSCGARMPKDEDPLDASLVAEIRSWIQAGAAED